MPLSKPCRFSTAWSHSSLRFELRAEALKVRAQVDILFTDEPISEDEIASFKEGFKVLKTFAQANLRYRYKSQAEQARAVLDQALKSPEA